MLLSSTVCLMLVCFFGLLPDFPIDCYIKDVETQKQGQTLAQHCQLGLVKANVHDMAKLGGELWQPWPSNQYWIGKTNNKIRGYRIGTWSRIENPTSPALPRWIEQKSGGWANKGKIVSNSPLGLSGQTKLFRAWKSNFVIFESSSIKKNVFWKMILLTVHKDGVEKERPGNFLIKCLDLFNMCISLFSEIFDNPQSDDKKNVSQRKWIGLKHINCVWILFIRACTSWLISALKEKEERGGALLIVWLYFLWLRLLMAGHAKELPSQWVPKSWTWAPFGAY